VTIYHDKSGITLHNGNCIDVLATLTPESVDSIVTDPPYGLAFMGKKWDYDVPAVAIWEQCLRVLKPGGHLLTFAGTRTQHRMAVRIEDAGFEIRDMIAWVYGSGFPKSRDISKDMDRRAGVQREIVGEISAPGMAKTNVEQGSQTRSVYKFDKLGEPITPEAKQWQGWGTALKPALEPITVARKPLRGTVAANVLQYGTGGMNVDGCRVAPTGEALRGGAKDGSSASKVHEGWDRPWKHDAEHCLQAKQRSEENQQKAEQLGRWPANLIHDGSNEVVGLFPETEPAKQVEGVKRNGRSGGIMGVDGAIRDGRPEGHDDSGGTASRFFYCAKADASERRDSKHPTVKPVALMRYLVRLVTPIGATVLDPFCGSGTTLEAAMLESCKAIGIELNPEYCADAVERLRQGVLF